MAIVSQQPDNFSTGVIRNIFIKVGFNIALNPTTINTYTVFLVNTTTQDTIDCVVDYIPGTNNITIQLFDFLASNTNYTVILVGGDEGIHELVSGNPFSDQSYIFSFTTGETKDWNIPLARKDSVTTGTPAFTGNSGIYRETFGRTGEAVSHIVTTAGQVGPSGTIVPAPFGAEQYLQASGTVPDIGDTFKLLSTNPANEEINIPDENVTFVFNSDLASIGSFEISVTDLLELTRSDENIISNYTGIIDGTDYTIYPSGTLTGFTESAVYDVTLNDVVDIIGNTIDSLSIKFYTKIAPFYSTVKLIRSLGQLIDAETDAAIRLLIYENSLWIYEHASPTFDVDSAPQEAKDYVTCKTKLDLIERRYLQGGQVAKKTLADLTIEYGSALGNIINRIVENLINCVNRNATALGAGLTFVEPASAIKAKNDPRMPISANSWVRLVSKDFI